jgi:hypothetical protein
MTNINISSELIKHLEDLINPFRDVLSFMRLEGNATTSETSVPPSLNISI